MITIEQLRDIAEHISKNGGYRFQNSWNWTKPITYALHEAMDSLGIEVESDPKYESYMKLQREG